MADAADAAEPRSPLPQDAAMRSRESSPAAPWHGFALQPTFLGMPVDVMLQVWLHLDDVAPLARVNRRLNELASDRHFQAQFFLHRHQPWSAIFHAIERPRMFHAELLDRLLRCGAVLSRALVQCLVFAYTGQGSHIQSDGRQWGKNITFQAWSAVVTAGADKYGNIPLKLNEHDQRVFTKWLYDPARKKADAAVRELFASYDFMPLPLIAHGERYDVHPLKPRIADALCKDATLAPLARANGYLPNLKDALAITRKIFREGSGEESTVEGIVRKIERLQNAGVAHLTRTVASNVIMGVRSGVGNVSAPEPGRRAYLALKELEAKGALSFSLREVVVDLLRLLSLEPSSSWLPGLLNAMSEDFQDLPISSALVPAVFRTAEDRGLHISEIHERIKHCKVCTADLMAVALCNATETVVCIEYGRKYLAGFATQAFVGEMLEHLVHQPYRGIFLQDLLRLEAEIDDIDMLDVYTPLTLEVARLDFDVTTLPTSSLCVHWWGTEVVWLSSAKSLLGCDWTNFANRVPPPNETHPRAVSGFTIFGFDGEEAKKVRGDATKPEERHVEALAVGSNVPEVDQTGLGRVETRSLAEVESRRLAEEQHGVRGGGTDVREELSVRQQKQRAQNIFGVVPEHATPLACEIVRALGASSAAAAIVMKHAVLNGNAPLVAALIEEEEVPVAMELIDITARLGISVPQALTDHIVTVGPPFRAFGHDSGGATKLPSSRSYDVSVSPAARREVEIWWSSTSGNHPHGHFELLHDTGDVRLEPGTTLAGRTVHFLPPRAPPSSSPPPSTPQTESANVEKTPARVKEEAPTAAPAQRRSGRATTRVSYADSPDNSEAPGSESESGSEEPEFHSESEDEQVWVEHERVPQRMSRRLQRTMHTSFKQWRESVSNLLAREAWANKIVDLIYKHAIMHGRRLGRAGNPARKRLLALDRALTSRLRGLEGAKAAGRDDSRTVEVDDLWKELQPEELPEVKARVNRALKKDTEPKRSRWRRKDRRISFLRSPYNRTPDWVRRLPVEEDAEDREDENWQPTKEQTGLDCSSVWSNGGYSFPSSSESSQEDVEVQPRGDEAEPGAVRKANKTMRRAKHKSKYMIPSAAGKASGNESSDDAEASASSKSTRKRAKKTRKRKSSGQKSSKSGNKRQRRAASTSESEPRSDNIAAASSAASGTQAYSASPEIWAEREEQQPHAGADNDHAIFLAATTFDMGDDSELSELESGASALSDAPSDEEL